MRHIHTAGPYWKFRSQIGLTINWVLSHFVPPDDPTVTDAMWLDAARRHFRGTVIVGKDLLEI